jgi:hypothetical protein
VIFVVFVVCVFYAVSAASMVSSDLYALPWSSYILEWPKLATPSLRPPPVSPGSVSSIVWFAAAWRAWRSWMCSMPRAYRAHPFFFLLVETGGRWCCNVPVLAPRLACENGTCMPGLLDSAAVGFIAPDHATAAQAGAPRDAQPLL